MAASSDLRQKARSYYSDLGIRADHPGADSYGEYFDHFWKARGRDPARDTPEEQLGYQEAGEDYISGCQALAANVAWQRELQGRHALAVDWARREQLAGRGGCGLLPAAVLRAHALDRQPQAIAARPLARARGAGRPRARPAARARGGDSGDSSDSDDGPAEPARIGGALTGAQGWAA